MIDNAPARSAGAAARVDGLGNVITVWSQSDGTRTNIWANAVSLARHDFGQRDTTGRIDRSTTRHAPATRHRAPCRRRATAGRRWRRATPPCWPGWPSRGRRRAPGWPRCSGRTATPESAGNSLRQRLFQLARRARRRAGQRPRDPGAGAGRAARPRRLATACSATPATSSGPSSPPGWRSSASTRPLRHGRRSTNRADAAEHARDYAGALAHARELLALEPLSEAAHRRVMRLLYLHGDRAAALLAFDRCEQVLKDEVGAAPSAETLALLATIERRRRAGACRRSAHGPAGERAAAAAPDRPRRRPGRRCTTPGTRAATPSSAAKAAWARAGWSATSPAPAAAPSSSAPGPATSGWSTLPRRACCAPCRARLPARPRPAIAAHARLAAARARRGGGAAATARAAPPLQRGQRRARGRGAGTRRLRLRRPALRRHDQHRAAAVRDRRIDAALDRHRPAPARCRRPAAPCSTTALAPGAEPVALAPLTLADSWPRSSTRSASRRCEASATAATLLRHCGGNPLYLLETLKAWLARGGAGRDAGARRRCRRACRSPAPCTR